MGAEAPPDSFGHIHQAVLYESDDEFLTVVVPFLEEGRRGNESTLVVLNNQATELLRTGLNHTTGITFVDAGDRHGNPASAIRLHRDVLTTHAAAGARRIRLVGEVPHPGVGRPWDPWARYEATINHAYAEFPLWNLCPYDLRNTSATVLDDVRRTHPHLTDADGTHQINPRYEDPAQFLARRPPTRTDPLETTPPAVDIIDPTPAVARNATDNLARTTLLDPMRVEDLVMAVSETVTNSLLHGRPPVRLRLWAATDRILVSVSDRGAGPTHPFAGLLPMTDSTTGGLGMWLTHQISDHVAFGWNDEGFTIHLVFDMPAAEGDGHAPRHA